MSDAGAVERAARVVNEMTNRLAGFITYETAQDIACAALAAAAPTAEEVHDRLELHDLAPQPRDGVMALDEGTEWWCFGCERVVGTGTDYDAVRHDHQSAQVVALWGAR